MPLFPSLPEPAHLMDLYARFPENLRPLMGYTDGLLRGEGALSVGERELIATYVSALNACTFCTGAHRAYAEVFGIDGALIDALIADFDTAPVDAKLRPILAYAAKLNTCQASWSRRMRRPSMTPAGLRPRFTRRCRSARYST